MDKTTKKRALILCTGNSCRSQVAQALFNAMVSDRWEAHSAGTELAGHVHLPAQKAFHVIGVSHPGRSKAIHDLPHKNFDLVITVCDDAAMNCPPWRAWGSRFRSASLLPSRLKAARKNAQLSFNPSGTRWKQGCLAI